jgi:uncharacterized protein (TIGR02444 family)
MPPGESTVAAGFWPFAEALYSREGVADACLWLQDHRGADVVMVLFCLWSAAVRGQGDRVLIARAATLSREWHSHVVDPLRTVRRWLKHTGCDLPGVPSDDCQTLRESIKDRELAAEEIQIGALESLAGPAPVSPPASELRQAMAQNLATYFRERDIEVDEATSHREQHLLTAARELLDGN